MRTALLILALAAMLGGCQSSRQQPRLLYVPVESRVETRVVHTESIDTVFVPLPRQSAERTTADSTSRLETDVAESGAAINPDGTLSHWLRNKDAALPVPVKSAADTVYVDRAVEKPVPVEIPVEVERKLTWWQKTRLNTWGWIATALTLCAGWIARKPLLTLARRLI